MKRIVSIMLVLALVIASSLTVAASNKGKAYSKGKAKVNKVVKFEKWNDGDIKFVIVDGKEIKNEGSPVIKYGKIKLPVRPITMGLGAQLNYNYTTHVITITKESKVIVINLETKVITVNGTEVKPNVITGAKKNQTVVLIKFIAETFGLKVNADEDCGTVNINKKVNIAVGKAATSDSEYAGNESAKANDGKSNTKWIAADGAFNHWWKVDLGSSYDISGTNVKWGFDKLYKYKIEVSSDNINWTLKSDKTANTNKSSEQKDEFTASAVRYVRVTVTGFEPGAWASVCEFKVMSTLNVSDTQVPTVPTNLTASAISATQVNLSWTASTDNVGVTGYKVFRNGVQLATVATGTVYTDTALTAATTYTYTVSAYDAAGNNSVVSTSAVAVTPLAADTQAPTVPTNLAATVSGTQVNLTWTASTDNIGVTGYKIYKNGLQVATVTTGTAYTDTTVTSGTTNTYTVSAFDAAGNNSALSAPYSVLS